MLFTNEHDQEHGRFLGTFFGYDVWVFDHTHTPHVQCKFTIIVRWGNHPVEYDSYPDFSIRQMMSPACPTRDVAKPSFAESNIGVRSVQAAIYGAALHAVGGRNVELDEKHDESWLAQSRP